ncbi:UNVERIFIED_CONTAM: hypothetical protein Slati_3146000 [Sesamum latifolium]|uniref:Uncharacterized protein n=1 Tax=Sesamum latifolium TaxID=2727402 RepID=A0AAW2UYN3_9LAMI
MEKVGKILHLFVLLFLVPFPSSSFPLCTDLRQPTSLKGRLAFCPYNGKVCCSSSQDLLLQKQFEAMNISDSACAAAVKSTLCASCDPFAASYSTSVQIRDQFRCFAIPLLEQRSHLYQARKMTASAQLCGNLVKMC